MCIDRLTRHLDPESSIKFYELAKKYSLNVIAKKVFKHIKDNVREVANTPD